MRAPLKTALASWAPSINIIIIIIIIITIIIDIIIIIIDIIIIINKIKTLLKFHNNCLQRLKRLKEQSRV